MARGQLLSLILARQYQKVADPCFSALGEVAYSLLSEFLKLRFSSVGLCTTSVLPQSPSVAQP